MSKSSIPNVISLGISKEEAKVLLHTHRIEKLLVVDADYRCTGLLPGDFADEDSLP